MFRDVNEEFWTNLEGQFVVFALRNPKTFEILSGTKKVAEKVFKIILEVGGAKSDLFINNKENTVEFHLPENPFSRQATPHKKRCPYLGRYLIAR